MDMKTLKPILVFLITASTFMTNVSMAHTIQPSPSSFHGTVNVNGSNEPVGAPISVRINSAQTNVQQGLTAIKVPTGFTCTTLDSKPTTVSTGEKPQSKVWTYAGSWFAVFPTSAAGASSAGTWVWRLVGTTWTEVLKLSPRTDTHADVLVDGSRAHILLWADTNTQFYSIEYVGGTYQLWVNRTTLVDISLPGSETATIALDSTGEMWLATDTSAGEIVVYHSVSPYSTWDGPIVLESGVGDDDIEVITALPNGSVGVFWSNQNNPNPALRLFGFRYHVDGEAATTWSINEVPASQSALNVGSGMADDHMNVAVASDSTLYMAIKTSYDTSGYPKMALLVRRPDGTWDDLYPVDEDGTRPLVLLDEKYDSLTFIYSSAEGYNPIVYQQSSTQGIVFDGRKTLRSGSFNDVSSMKSNIEDGFVVIYSSSTEVAGQYCSKDEPIMTDIPNQTIAEGASFTTIALDDYVSDVDNTDEEMTWLSSGDTDLSVSIDDRVATITPLDPDWNGSDTITFRATDPDGFWDEDAATFTVIAVNDAPVLDPIGPKSTAELVPLVFQATATDIDVPANTLIYSLADGTGGSVPEGAGIDSTSGDFSWTPTEAQGPETDTFDVCVSDGSLSDCETITVTVNEVATPPNAVPDAYDIMVNDTLLVSAPGVLANDSDMDIPADTLTAILGTSTTHGDLILNPDGLFVYVPDPMWSGIDTFIYKVYDGTSYSEPVSVTITVKLVKYYLPVIYK
jgi:hypothetical protein